MSSAADATGGCQCGAVRYSITGPLKAYCCHRSECRKQSSSAFGISVPVMERSLSIDGEMGLWTRPTDSGSLTECYFCTQCGSRLYHSGRNRPGLVTVKGGSLDDPSNVQMLGHIWVKSKPDWLVLSDGLPQLETQPQTMEEWTEFLGIA